MDEIFQGFQSKQAEHLLLVVFAWAEVARQKRKVLIDGDRGAGCSGGRGFFCLGSGGNRHFQKINSFSGLARCAGKLVSGGWEELV